MNIYTSTYINWHSIGSENLVDPAQVIPITTDIQPSQDDWLVVWQPNESEEIKKVLAVIDRFDYNKRVLIHYEGRYKRPHGYGVRYQQLFGRIYTNVSTDVDNKTIKYSPIPCWATETVSKWSSAIPIKSHPFISSRPKLIASVVTNICRDGEPRPIVTNKLKALGMDVYGSGNLPIPNDQPRNYQAKIAVLSNYTFCFACENQLDLGHLTEKPFDAILAGCVLIYLGPLDSSLFIPDSCYINYRDFWSEADLMHHIKTMSLARIHEYQEAIANNRSDLVGMRSFNSCIRYICRDLGFNCECPYYRQLTDLSQSVANRYNT